MQISPLNRIHSLPIFLAAFGFLLVGVSPSRADSSVPVDPFYRSLGMGGGFVGLASGVPALYHNPAGMGRTIVYTLQGGYMNMPQASPFYAKNTWHVAVVDSKTDLLAGGVGYSYLPGGDLGEHEARGALSYPIIPQRMYFGLGGTYRFSDALDDNLSVDAGVMVALPMALTAGLVVRNAYQAAQRGAHRQFGAGIGFNGPLAVGADALYTPDQDHPWTSGVGVELVIAQSYPFRFGYRNEGGQHYLSGGIGLSAIPAGLGFSYQQNIQDSDDRILVFGMRANL